MEYNNDYQPQTEPQVEPQAAPQPEYPPQYPAPLPQYRYQPIQQTYPQPFLLVFGILSLAISFIPGIILGVIGRKKGNAYLAQGGVLTGASKVGYILSKAGIIVSIVVTVLVTLYILLVILLVAGIAAQDAHYY